MSCPVFVLKTNNETDPKLRLINPCGEGNAIPTVSIFDDLDHRFELASGNVGKVPLRLQHNLTLSMDQVPPEIRKQLLEWKFQRRMVTLDPNGLDPEITDDTFYSIKPSDELGTTPFSDAAGKIGLTCAFSPLKLVWDESKQQLIERASNDSVTEQTEFGPAWRLHGPGINYGDPSFPMSAQTGFGIGKMGWDITIGGSTSEFLQDVFPGVEPGVDSVRFTRNADGPTVLSIPDTQLVPPFVGIGRFHFSVWVKGKMGMSNSLYLNSPGANVDTKIFSGKVYPEWTRIELEVEQSSWAGGPSLLWVFNNTEDDDYDFEVAIQMASFLDTIDCCPNPHYCVDQTAISPGHGYVRSAGDSTMYTSGTMTMDFIIPDTVDLASEENWYIGLADFGASGGRGRWHLVRTGTEDIKLTVTGTDNFVVVIPDELLSPGRHLWTVTYEASPGRMVLIANGVMISDQALTVTSWSADSYLRLGSSVSYGNSLFYFLGMRMERNATPTETVIADHKNALNSVARGTYDLAQGRWYEIVSVPQTPLIQEGDAIYMGDLVLRQIDYDHGAAIWYADEDSV